MLFLRGAILSFEFLGGEKTHRDYRKCRRRPFVNWQIFMDRNSNGEIHRLFQIIKETENLQLRKRDS